MNRKSGDHEPGMSLIVKTVTRLTVGLILIYGMYIVMRGHISPGGGFAGGVIIALSFTHLMLAFGKQAVLEKINEARGILIAGFCGILFLCIAARSFFYGGYRALSQAHNSLFAGGSALWLDITISVAAGVELFVIFLALVLFTSLKEKEK